MSTPPTPPVVLSIAGTDSGGAAGLAADLSTFAALGVHGACVVTAVTAQDTTGVRAIHPVPLDIVAAQLEAVLVDLPVAVVKTGMLADPAVVRLVADRCAHLPLVVDPVLVATSGAALAGEAVVDAYEQHLLPLATVVTPNRFEAEALAVALTEAEAVVRTGSESGRDVLQLPGHPPYTFTHAVVPTDNDHGTGCTFSAALAAYLAHGRPLGDAVALAGDFTAAQLRISSTWELGRGRGSIAHITDPITTGGTR